MRTSGLCKFFSFQMFMLSHVCYIHASCCLIQQTYRTAWSKAAVFLATFSRAHMSFSFTCPPIPPAPNFSAVGRTEIPKQTIVLIFIMWHCLSLKTVFNLTVLNNGVEKPLKVISAVQTISVTTVSVPSDISEFFKTAFLLERFPSPL